MKLSRTLFSALALALVIAPASCSKQKPDGTNPPEDGDGDGKTAKRHGKRNKDKDGGDGGGGEDGGGDGGGEPKKCDAQTADAPTPLFGEKVLIRPPINVDLHEENPTFAVAQTSGGFVSACEGTVDRMTMIIFQNDKKKPLAKYADEFYQALEKNGYTGGTREKPLVETDTDYAFAADYPASGGNPASKMYIALKRRQDVIIALTYQTRPEEYGKLEPTFKASADSLLVAPPS